MWQAVSIYWAICRRLYRNDACGLGSLSRNNRNTPADAGCLRLPRTPRAQADLGLGSKLHAEVERAELRSLVYSILRGIAEAAGEPGSLKRGAGRQAACR